MMPLEAPPELDDAPPELEALIRCCCSFCTAFFAWYAFAGSPAKDPPVKPQIVLCVPCQIRRAPCKLRRRRAANLALYAYACWQSYVSLDYIKLILFYYSVAPKDTQHKHWFLYATNKSNERSVERHGC